MQLLPRLLFAQSLTASRNRSTDCRIVPPPPDPQEGSGARCSPLSRLPGSEPRDAASNSAVRGHFPANDIQPTNEWHLPLVSCGKAFIGGKFQEMARQQRHIVAPLSKRSEEHTSELQSLMRISYAVFCLKKKNKNKHNNLTKLSMTQ